MHWEPDSFSLRQPASALPSLLDSSAIDEAVNARKTGDDEPKPGAELISPVTLLAEHFPHILARVVQFWGQESQIDGYFERLVMMDRHDRAGFPKRVMDALLEVWCDHRDRLAKSPDGQCLWGADNQLHKAFKKLDQELAFIKRKGLTGAEAAALDAGLTELAKAQINLLAEQTLSTTASPTRQRIDAPDCLRPSRTLGELLGD